MQMSSENGDLERESCRRLRLPAPMRPRGEFSVWEFLRNCVGKELTRVAMPVHFNEPLTFLQRVCEYLEYWQLLQQAAQADDVVKRMELISAFIVSGTSYNAGRLGKPFNPLLSETYELQHRGFRAVCEQVSHHPPTSAFHAEAVDGSWVFHGSITPKLTFWGKSVEVTPKGCVTVELPARGEIYTWQNALCVIHNIIVGSMWIEQSGEMQVTNHSSGHTARLKWKSASSSSPDCHRVDGFIHDSAGDKVRALYGKWTECLYSVPVSIWKQRKSSSSNSKASSQLPGNDSDCFNLNLPDQRLLWLSRQRPPDSESFYSFTEFTVGLNDDSDSQQMRQLPPTDSRRRPDVRAMESGELEVAQAEKLRLEDKQRKVKGSVKPKWFAACKHEVTGKDDWKFNSEYWKRDWSSCQDIF